MSIDFVDQLNSFSWSIGIMLFLFAGEFLMSVLLKKKVFDFSDTLANAACGIIERGVYILFAVVYYGAFDYVFQFRLFTIPVNWWSIIILFFAVDFLWYVYHLIGHVVNVFWAAHITHHQSEQYNFSLSFRVSSLQLVVRLFFWMLLPLLGFDPFVTTMIIGVNAAYQFFIHTQLIDKLGFLEHFLVTPSHHRVHHGKNPQYIDKNYGGIFIIWDKLFGTFEKEEEVVKYGITKPLNSSNPIVAWFHYYVDLYKASKMQEGIGNKIKLWFSGPESLSSYYDSIETEVYQPNALNTPLKIYLGVQFSFLCFVCIIMFNWYGNLLFNDEIYYLILFVSYSSISFASVLDNKQYAFYLEIGRILLTSAILYYLTVLLDNAMFYYVSGAYLILFSFWLLKLKEKLLNYKPVEEATN